MLYSRVRLFFDNKVKLRTNPGRKDYCSMDTNKINHIYIKPIYVDIHLTKKLELCFVKGISIIRIMMGARCRNPNFPTPQSLGLLKQPGNSQKTVIQQIE